MNDGVLRSRLVVVKSSGRSPAAMSRSLVCVRRQALGLYRSLLRTAQHWEANDVEDTVNERNYIRHEAKELFAENKHETDPERIQALLEEGKSRIQIAQHYNNPYPRPMNLSQRVVMNSRNKAAQKRLHRQSKPI
eukprot:scpid109488/ scgid18412/ LYR motif-containing protein 1